VLRDSRIRISIILRITITIQLNYPDHEVKIFLDRNHDHDPGNAILSDIFKTSIIPTDPHFTTQLLTLTGDIDLKSTDVLTLFFDITV